MPHQCTDCGRAFEDGSTEMLSGCPDCGGTTFQFRPEGVENGDTTTSAEPPEPELDSTVARTVGNAATAVRDLVGGDDDSDRADPAPTDARSGSDPDVSDRASTPETSPADGEASSTAPTAARETAPVEDAAQASARTEVVPPEELPESPAPAAREEPRPRREPDEETDDPERADQPDLAELREQLNQQFESIRVVAPGQYELNLMELYDREEYIIALQEDGKYTIQVPERWRE